MDQELFNPQSSSVTSSRILYTPSTFARTSLLHLQEVGSLQAIHPHTSTRTNLTSFLCFVVLSGNGTLTYEGTTYELSAGDCVFIDCRKESTGSSGECEHRCGSQGQGKMDKPIIIETKKYEDFRGWLSVPLDKEINFHVVQINQGYSRKKFTLRGLHYQEGEHAQAKLVSCLHGSIFNVAVDLRPGETYGHAYGVILSFENQKQMYIPRGFAHGYLTLEDDTLMQWCVDNDFCAEAARAVRYDSDFIWESESWPAGEYIVSAKDRNAEKFPFSIRSFVLDVPVSFVLP